MLPKKFRLPSSELLSVRTRGKRIRISPFEFRYMVTSNAYSRLAIIVPKRLDKRATVRNRQKRLLSEALIPVLSAVSPAFDGILTVQQLCLEPPTMLQERLKKIVKNLR